MNGFVKFIVLILALAIGNVIYKANINEPVKVPPETWWGPGDPSKEDKSIVPFKINVSNEVRPLDKFIHLKRWCCCRF
jgi:hypothetical protein